MPSILNSILSQFSDKVCKPVEFNIGEGKVKYRHSGIDDGIQITVNVFSDTVEGVHEKAVLKANEEGYWPSFMMKYY